MDLNAPGCESGTCESYAREKIGVPGHELYVTLVLQTMNGCSGMNFSAPDNWIGAPGMEFNVPRYDLVLRIMNFSALDNGLVRQA